MEMTELYKTAKNLIEEVKKVQPEAAAVKDAALCVIITEEQDIYAGVNGVKIVKGEVAPASPEYNAVLAMIADGKSAAQQVIKVNFEDGSVIKPENECVEMLYRVSASNSQCDIAVSAEETVKADTIAQAPVPAEEAENNGFAAFAEPVEEAPEGSEELSFEEKFEFAFDDSPAPAEPVPTLADQAAAEAAAQAEQEAQNIQQDGNIQSDPNVQQNMYQQNSMPMYGDPSQVQNPQMMNQQYPQNGMNPQMMNQQYPQNGMNPQMMNQQYPQNGVNPQMMNQQYQQQMMNQQMNPQYAQPIAQPYGYNPNAGSVQFGQMNGQNIYQNANPYYQQGGASQPLSAFPAQSSHYGASSHYVNTPSQSQPVSSVAVTGRGGSKFRERFNSYVNDDDIGTSSSSSNETDSMSMNELIKQQRDKKKNAKMSADFKKRMKDMGY